MKRLGFEAHAVALEAFDINDAERFDVVSMADALEHMPFPKQTLLSVRRLLVDGGHLFLSMPNADCFGWRAYDALRANPYWGEIEHLHNFGRKRLCALLRECGFEPKSYAVNERYFVGMEVVAEKQRDLPI
jgi:2-polyprenyl-3-methyl-5-hydroxy-6-metoxy-1,4-benzoquinol methylase